MTDLEINKALALAIGWTKADFLLYPEHLVLLPVMRRFDHTDWPTDSREAYEAIQRELT